MESMNKKSDSVNSDSIALELKNDPIEVPQQLFECINSAQFDVQSLCRICLSTNNSGLMPLISDGKCEVLADMFTIFTSIPVCQNDGLPSKLCMLCKDNVVKSFHFKKKCQKSDYILKLLLENVKEEPKNSKVALYHCNELEKNQDITQVKEESDFIEGIEYLEDDSDVSAIIIENIKKEKTKIKGLEDTITDPENIFSEIVTEKNTLKKKKQNKTNVCSICSQKFAKPKNLKAHMKVKHESTTLPHSCGQCEESFTSEHDLYLHSALHNESSWQCNKCDKKFNGRTMLRRHLQRHMQWKRFACDGAGCGKAYSELYALRRHQRVHTGQRAEKKHQCPVCDKRYSSRGQLAAHAQRHSGARPCACACGKAFPSARLLASHRLVHDQRKPYACTYCDKRFRHESTRNTHHRTHTGDKPYVCSACGKSFIQNSNLTLHMRTHTGERPYKCGTCERKFSSGSALKNHLRTHTGEKPYACTVCGKRFSRKVLSAHMRRHSGERPFACTVCPNRFVTAARLRDHCRVHTGEKPFECAVCMQKFSTKSHLVKHVKTHDIKKKAGVVYIRHAGDNQTEITHENNENIHAQNVSEVNTLESDVGAMTIIQQMPSEVAGELVLDDDGELKTNILVVDNSHNVDTHGQSTNICLTGNDVSFVDAGDVNLVTVNEGEVSISASSATLQGATVKLYQLDQSLVQIHSSGGQVTISKITSKMTANF